MLVCFMGSSCDYLVTVMQESDCVLVNDCNLAQIAWAGQAEMEKWGFLLLWEGSRIGAVAGNPALESLTAAVILCLIKFFQD